MERAEIVRDVRAQKMERSLGREKVGKERGVSFLSPICVTNTFCREGEW